MSYESPEYELHQLMDSIDSSLGEIASVMTDGSLSIQQSAQIRAIVREELQAHAHDIAKAVIEEITRGIRMQAALRREPQRGEVG